ncbi:MarR family transcriptional regulator [Secundilactobacillus oryzae JCM 18671]|uniref:MarR family transcriptional regulator n=1 Tax=Secundilactobacillus oryzae JCM 18671 TaxID=1291743 RepID=A0A081BG02_9LACO|nr:helix-turn-helix domain-containing protein [Secundilactobacillus oryzae]GAK46970.1 MarR family transcriptional regulator [Secundilactobacillus oryzae JCM 18671]
MSETMQYQNPVDFELCPRFAKTFAILGKKWNGLIIDVLLNLGPQRFKTLAEKVVACSDRVLVERLKELEDEGIITRNTHVDSSLIDYSLTEKGLDLANTMANIHDWSEKWYDVEGETVVDQTQINR